MSRVPRSFPYLAHVVPGLEAVAEAEMETALELEPPVRVLRAFDQRTSVLVVRVRSAPERLLRLGTVEDVFALAAEEKDLPPARAGLAAARAAVARGSGVEGAFDRARSVRPRRRGKVTFRVIARRAGDHAFRRVDLQRAIELGVLDRFPAWRLVPDDAQFELWVTLVGTHLLLGVRLSDGTMRGRDYRSTSLPAALKPTVARGLALLSVPRDDDVVLDPMCGSGTVLIERALAGRYRLLLGGDSAEEAVQAARANIGPRYRPIELRRWDARRLPLDDASVSAILCNLPFGRQIGTPDENRLLYPALLAEWRRVLRPGGRMVLLGGDKALLRRAVQRQPSLRVTQQLPVLVRGYPATIQVVTSSVPGAAP